MREGKIKASSSAATKQQRAAYQSDQDGFSQRLGIKEQRRVICLHQAAVPKVGGGVGGGECQERKREEINRKQDRRKGIMMERQKGEDTKRNRR